MWEQVKQPQAPARRPVLTSLRPDDSAAGRALPSPSPAAEDDDLPVAPAAPRPVFGPTTWPLGLAAALPAVLSALVLLACAGGSPRLPALPPGPALGILLISLGVGAVFAYAANFPAWSHPGVALIPSLILFLPTAALYAQVVGQINGDPDLVVLAPLAILWLLLAASAAVTALIAFAVSHRAPSFSGIPLLPLPLIFSWCLILAPTLREPVLFQACGSALALTAIATFAAWIAPPRARPAIPLAAIVAQIGFFWLRRFHWPALTGAARLSLALDLLLIAGLVAAIGSAPFVARWVHRGAWPVLRRALGVSRE